MQLNYDVKELKTLHSARGEIYSFLSRVYANVPNEELYKMLEKMLVKLENLLNNSDNDKLISGINGLKEFVKERKQLKGQDLADFDLETLRHYTALLGLTTSIPTDESIYTSEEHREKMDSYDAMVKLFRKYGLEKSNKLSENEDFISYELIFISHLAYNSIEALKKNLDEVYGKLVKEQYDFHVNHFDKWVYDFFARIETKGIEKEKLYKYFAQFSAGFIAEDKKLLGELISKLA